MTKNLKSAALERIIKHTKIPLTKEIEEKAKLHLGGRRFIDDFNLWHYGFTANRSPTKTGKDIGSAIIGCKKLNNIISRQNMNDEDSNDFAYIYNLSRNEFGNNYIPKIEETVSFLRRLEFVLKKAEEINTLRKGKNSAHTEDFSMNRLMDKLMFIFQEIYKRKPTINSKPSNGGKNNSPFLRFSSQTIKEISALGYDIDEKSYTVDAIRQRCRNLIGEKQVS